MESLTTSFANNDPFVSTTKVNLSGECIMSTANLSSGRRRNSSVVNIHSLQNIQSDAFAIVTVSEISSNVKTRVGQQSTNDFF